MSFLNTMNTQIYFHYNSDKIISMGLMLSTLNKYALGI